MPVMLRFLIRFLLALCLGIGVALFLIGRNPRVHKLLESRLMAHFEKSLECKLYGTIVSVNFFSPTMVVEKAGASSHTPHEWQWHAKQCTFSFSYLELIRTGKIAVSVHVDGPVVHSVYANGDLPLKKHLEKLVSFPQDVPLALKKLLVTNAKSTIYSPDKAHHVQLDFKAEASTVGSQFKTTLYITDGNVLANYQQRLQSLTGNIAVAISRDPQQTDRFGLVADLALVLPQLASADQHCSLFAEWKQNKGTLALNNKNQTCVVENVDIALTPSGTIDAHCTAHVPLAAVEKLYTHGQASLITGDCSVTGRVRNIGTEAQKVEAQLSVHKGSFRGMHLEQLNATIVAADGIWNAALELRDPLFDQITGTAIWDEKKQCADIVLENSVRLSAAPFKYWHVMPQGIELSLHAKSSGILDGVLQAIAHHEKTGAQAAITGKLHLDKEQLTIKGAVNDKPYALDVALTPHVLLHTMLVTDQAGKELISLHAGANPYTLFEGIVTLPFLRTLLMSGIGYDLRGQGDIKVKTALKDTKLYAQLELPDGNIRLGTTYNYIQQAVLPLEIDLSEKRCVVIGSHLKLHKGSVRCDRATFHYNNQGQITFAHVPLLINKLFLNVGKDMFVVLSGYIVLTYHKGATPFVQGTLSIDRAQVKQNILSGNVQGSLLKDLSSSLIGTPFDGAFSIHLRNRHPLQVRTNVLQTDLEVDLHCKGSFSAPRVEGVVNLIHGKLQFPYRPLTITNGILHFEGHQPDDPRIELTAKGTIKRYTVTMQVGGTVRNPTFSFNASPALDEEQIITLLLAGSEAGSLSLVMPSLIMQNVQNYIFGTEHGSSTVETYVNNVLAPFKHIRIVPSFSDQTARGGFRGAIEIDVSDRLHAVIQKNFSLTEDTRVELEFKVSDDFNVRGIKDERGDLGGELETKISF